MPLVWSVSAQAQYFSFEASEGFELKGISGQGEWAGGFDTLTFVVSNEQASDGVNSLKIVNTGSSQGFQDYLTSGLFTNVEGDIVSTTADVYITDSQGKDSFYSISGQDENSFLGFIVEFNPDNTIGLLLKQDDGTFAIEVVENFQYERDTWFQLRVDKNFGTGAVNYSINDQLIYEDAAGNFAASITSYFFSLIDNVDAGAAYFDNLNSVVGTSAADDFDQQFSLRVFPNPASNVIVIESERVVEEVAVLDMLGKNVMSLDFPSSRSELTISSLTAGVYFLRTTVDGKPFVTKFVKN